MIYIFAVSALMNGLSAIQSDNVKHDVSVFLDIIFMPGNFILGENLYLNIWETQTMGNLKCG